MTTRYKRIGIGDISVEADAQRSLRPSWVQTIADDLDESGLGVMHVASNGSGTYYVMDGQHRIAALREWGASDNYEVRCLVYEGLSKAERAAKFRQLNRTRNIRAFDDFKVAVTEGDPDAVDIKRIVESFGLHILDQKKDGSVCAVNQLKRVYSGRVLKLDDGPYPEVLRTTIDVLYQAWGTEAQAYNGPIIEGLGAFLLRFGDEIDPNRLARKLSQRAGGPTRLLADAKQLADMRRTVLRHGVADILVDTYNHRLRSNSLPAWDRS